MTVPAVTPVEQPACLAGAIECGKRGFRVFPVHSVRGTTCTCQSWRDKNEMGPCDHPGKHPRLRDWQERATTDPVAIEEFWWNHKGPTSPSPRARGPASSCWTSTSATAAAIPSIP